MKMVMKMRLNLKLVLSAVLFSLITLVQAEETQLSKAIQDQVTSAADCEVMAYGVELKYMDANDVFAECVERRAILIGMQKRHGPGQYGEIDIFDKIEGYSYLAGSENERVKKEASTYSTAAGAPSEPEE